MNTLTTGRFSCLPYALLAERWVIEGSYAAWAARTPPEPATEEERIRLLCEEVERINQAVPVNNGRPAILGELA